MHQRGYAAFGGGRVWVVGEMKWSSHFVDFETQAHMLS